MHTHACTHTYILTSPSIKSHYIPYICIFTYTHTHPKHMYTHAYIRTYAHHTQMHAYIRTFVNAYMHTYIYIYTHTLACVLAWLLD